jgi:hypothetical protein
VITGIVNGVSGDVLVNTVEIETTTFDPLTGNNMDGGTGDVTGMTGSVVQLIDTIHPYIEGTVYLDANYNS